MTLEGGVPFEEASDEAQLVIRGVLEGLGSINFCLTDGCTWLLLKMQLLILHGQLNKAFTLDAPNNLVIRPEHLRLSDTTAAAVVSDMEIPDTVSGLWPEED